MKAKVQTILMLALLLALTVLPIVLAQDTVGVKAGDWVLYSITRLGSSFAWVEDAVWIKVEVLNVSDTTVTIRETIHYDDGSEWVSNSSYSLHGDMYRYVIAANLGPGDKVGKAHDWFKNWTGYVNVDVTLNDTAYRSYGGVTREVNQLIFSRLLKDAFAPCFRNGTLEKYWDKRTGFLLEWKIQEWYIPIPEEGSKGKESSSTYRLEIVDTNMWEMEKPPQQSFLWLAAIPVGAVIAVAVAVKVRNNRKKEETDKQ